MGDLPEPKKQVQGTSSQDRFLTKDLLSRGDGHLGLDQVNILTNQEDYSL